MSNATPKTEAELDGVIRETLAGLRRMMAEDMKACRIEFPDFPLPCETCAFRTTTDEYVGFDRTVLLLFYALINSEPFYCHTDPKTGQHFPQDDEGYMVPRALERGDTVNLCAGRMALEGRDPNEIIGLFVDAVNGSTVDRPIKPEMCESIKRIAAVVVSDRNQKGEI